MKKVIIPAAKFVPEELQTIGKLSPIIYPINEKMVFNYLYAQYHEKNHMVIVCCEGASKVHNQLDKFCDANLEIVDLEQLQDLGHTIYSAIEDTDCQLIINFADTIVLDDLCDESKDVIVYAEEEWSNIWGFFDINDGIIERIYEKIDTGKSGIGKVFTGVFYIKDAKQFKNCLKKSFENNSSEISSFFRAIQIYSRNNPFMLHLAKEWFDIGHTDKYINSSIEVKAREFNHIEIEKNRGILKKTSDNYEKFCGEIKWYLKLPAELEYTIPRIFSYSTAYTDAYVCMEYYAYHTIHELFLHADLTRYQWRDIFKRIHFVYEDFQKFTVRDVYKIKKSLEDMYLKKTLDRLSELRRNENFVPFFEKKITINSKKYMSLDEICYCLKKVIPFRLINIDTFSIIHGDLCFSNILIDNNYNFIKLIDPRGAFGEYDIYGDSRYELAKLMHSIDGKYDYIIKDMFFLSFNTEEANIDYKILCREYEFDIYEIFKSVFEKELHNDLEQLELIEALLFLSMIILHGEDLRHQMVMLATGLEILSRVLNICC